MSNLSRSHRHSTNPDSGIWNATIGDLPVAVIDIETTGVSPHSDRIVEISVVRVEPGGISRLAFDTLINPGRPMRATEIHGITTADVAGAPRFSEIAANLWTATAGCVVTAYNAYFDMKFLTQAFAELGWQWRPPYFCVMYWQSLLYRRSASKLSQACGTHRIPYLSGHQAAHDAWAAARVYQQACWPKIQANGWRTYGQIASQRSYKFNDSFQWKPHPEHLPVAVPLCHKLVSRAGAQSLEVRSDLAASLPKSALCGRERYWAELRKVIARLNVTPADREHLQACQHEWNLSDAQVRALHARVLTTVCQPWVDEGELGEKRMVILQQVMDCLSDLGWAPGETSECSG